MGQRSIRFPDDLEAEGEAEADRLGYPHTFSSLVVNFFREGLRAAAAARGGHPTDRWTIAPDGTARRCTEPQTASDGPSNFERLQGVRPKDQQ